MPAERSTKRPGGANAKLGLIAALGILLLPSPSRALLVTYVRIDRLARETYLAVIVRIDKVAPIRATPDSPVALEAALVTATVLANVAGEFEWDLEGPLTFVTGGQVWSNCGRKYEFKPGEHWMVCLQHCYFIGHLRTVCDQSNAEGVLSAMPIPRDVLDEAVRETRRLKPGKMASRRWNPTVDRIVRDELGENYWAGVNRNALVAWQDDEPIRLFQGLLKLHEIILSSEHLFDCYHLTKVLRRDEKGRPCPSSAGERLTFAQFLDSVGGLQLPPAEPARRRALKVDVDLLDPEAQKELPAMFDRADARREEALVVLVRALEALHDAAREDTRVWFPAWELDPLARYVDVSLGREHVEVSNEGFDLARTLEEYLRAVPQEWRRGRARPGQ